MERTVFSSLADYSSLVFLPILIYTPLKLAYSHAPERAPTTSIVSRWKRWTVMLAIPTLIDLAVLFIRHILFVIAFLVFRVFRFLHRRFDGEKSGSELGRYSWGRSWMIVNTRVFNFLLGVPIDVEN